MKEEPPLRKLNDAISRFCARHPHWGIPGLMRYVVIGSVIMYVLIFVTQYAALNLLGLRMEAVLHGEVWRLVTFIFMPISLSPLALALSL